MVELVPTKQNGANGKALEVFYCVGLRRIKPYFWFDFVIFIVDVDIEADNDSKSSRRHPYESSSTSEVGLHAYCR